MGSDPICLAVIVQPLTGIWMMSLLGYDFSLGWLRYSLILFVVAGLCWLPVVWTQIKVRDLAAQAASDGQALSPRYHQLMRYWFMLGWLAFLSVVGIFYLMVLEVDPIPDSTVFWPMHTIDSTLEGADGVDLVDIDGDGDRDAVVGWEEAGQVILHENPGPRDVRNKWNRTNISGGLNVRKIEDAKFADFNSDGRIDAVVSATENHNEKVGIHWLVDRQDIFNKDSWKGVWIDPTLQLLFLKVAVGQIDGIGANDIVVGSKNDTKPARLVWYRAPEKPDYTNSDQWKGWPIADINWIASIAIIDINQDGDNDVLMSDGNILAWFENPGQADLLEGSQSKWARHVISTGAKVYFTNCAVDKKDPSTIHLIVSAISANSNTTKGSTLLHSIRKDLDKRGNWSGKWVENKLATLDPMPRDMSKNDYDIKGIACGNIDSNENVDLVISASGYGHGVFALMNMEDKAGDQALHLKVISSTNYNTRKGIKHDNLLLDDLDGDGDLDIIVTEENGNMEWYFIARGLGLIWYENPLRK